MNYLELIEKALRNYPWFRERKDKNLGIAKLIVMKYHPWLAGNEEKLADLVVLAGTLDRAWRKILQDNPELRGLDYEDKAVLEQEKQMELGYEVGFDSDIKNKRKYEQSTTNSGETPKKKRKNRN